MGLRFSDLKNSTGAGPLQQGSSTEGSATGAGASAFYGANNMQINGGTFIVAGRDNITQTINHFHGVPPPSDDLISKIRDWLAPKINFRSIQIETFKKRAPDTGKWLLEGGDFRGWLSNKGAILWGTGIPGAGKTVVASIVIHYLETFAKSATPGEVSAAFAYSRYSETIPVEEILGGLLDQQLEQYPSLARLVEPLYKEHQNGKTKPTQNELVDMLVKFSKIFKTTFYVLDGIDETPRNVQFNLVQVLRMIDANFLITSRPLENLESELPEAKLFKIVAHEDDIIILISEVISRNPDLRRLLVDLAFKREVIKKILEKSAGMFLHAALQLEALQDCLSASDIRSTLDELPAGLDGMYTLTVARIKEQSTKRVALAVRILVLVVHAEESLAVQDLQYALAADLDSHTFDPDRVVDEVFLLSVCCGLIYVEKESNTVRLIHFTAKDALQPILLTDFPSPHAFLASTCISRLISCGLHESDIHDDTMLYDVFNRHPFLYYAYYYWASHARRCDPQSPGSQCVSQFLDRCQSFPLRIDIEHLWGFVRGTGLHVASHYDILSFLTSGIPDPNIPTLQHGLRPLILALRHPTSGATMLLLNLPGIDINIAKIRHGLTSLMIASYRGYEDVVDCLLGHNELEVNAPDHDGITALGHAAKEGHERVVKRLLRNDRINVNVANNGGMTAEMLAALHGHQSIMQLLLEYTPRGHLEVQSSVGTRLKQASKQGRLDTVEQLLELSDASVNAPDDHGYTALILASFYGHESVVQRLLRCPGIQVNFESKKGYTSLLVASERGYAGVVRQLLGVDGIEVNKKLRGSPALHTALNHDHASVVQELLRHPRVHVNATDDAGWTLLMCASLRGYTGVVEQLLAHPGIDVNARNTSGGWMGSYWSLGWTLLIAASWSRRDDVIRLLLGHPNIEVNCADDRGSTALMEAAKSGEKPILRLLLSHPGIDVNATDKRGSTALMWASYNCRLGCVKELLEFPGVQLDAVDTDGETALSLGEKERYEGYLDVVRLISDAISYRH